MELAWIFYHPITTSQPIAITTFLSICAKAPPWVKSHHCMILNAIHTVRLGDRCLLLGALAIWCNLLVAWYHGGMPTGASFWCYLWWRPRFWWNLALPSHGCGGWQAWVGICWQIELETWRGGVGRHVRVGHVERIVKRWSYFWKISSWLSEHGAWWEKGCFTKCVNSIKSVWCPPIITNTSSNLTITLWWKIYLQLVGLQMCEWF